MKKLIATAIIAAVALVAFTTSPGAAALKFDDMSWWGNSGATPEPYPDPKGRSGYWWWPTDPASNAGDAELWGNRGVVYHSPWEKPAPPAPPMDPPKATPTVEARKPVENTVLFDFDKSTIKAEAKPVLDAIVGELKEFGSDTIVVEGHTCNIGTDQYNQGLSERRANAVVNYLTSAGIAQSRIMSKGLGESTPAVPNDSPANRAKNRRAYFKTTVVQ